MAINPTLGPDPEGPDDVWMSLDWSGALCEESDALNAARERAAFDAPDTLDHLIEVADMMTMQAAQRLIGVNLLRREALADPARHDHANTDIVDRSVRLEVAAALRITETEAGRLMTLGQALVEQHPRVLDSFAGARMTERHAEILVDALGAVEIEFHEQILPRALELAETQPLGTFRRALRALVETVRASTLDERHEASLARRRVMVQPEGDGMAWLMAYLPEVEAHAIMGRATAIAKVLAIQEGETRTLDQLRSDVIADLLIEGETGVHPEGARGIRASVAVTVPVLALLDDHLAAAAEPPVVEGIGPIPLARAKQLCGSSDGWTRILTHPETGIVLSVGRTRYRPPPSLRRLVRWRADRCMGPGCGMPASRCEIDHRVAYREGGHTSLRNLNPFCKGHHTVKHHGGWVVREMEGSGGAVEWISPTGRRYVVEPERRVPVFLAQSAEDAPF